jgi:hypothetical protein
MIYWVATYGDMGLEVEHFAAKAEYELAVHRARADWEHGELDSYTNGELEGTPPA